MSETRKKSFQIILPSDGIALQFIFVVWQNAAAEQNGHQMLEKEEELKCLRMAEGRKKFSHSETFLSMRMICNEGVFDGVYL